MSDTETTARPSILGGGLAVGTSTAVRMVAGFAVSVVVARVLGPAAKGELALAQQVPAVAALLLGFGFEGAHAYFVGRHDADAEHALSDSLLIAGFAALVGIPAAAAIMRYLLPALDRLPAITLIVASIAIPLIVLGNLSAGILTGQGRVGRQALAQVVSALSVVAFVTALALTGAMSVGALVAVSVASIGLAAVWSALATSPRRLHAPSLARLRASFVYARRNYVQNVAGYLELRQDILLLGALANAASVGIYTVAVSFAELLFFAPQALAPALTARALKEDESQGAELTAMVTRLLTAFTVVATIALAVVLPWLISAVFGPRFSDATIVFALLAPGVLAGSAASQPTAYLASHGRLFPGISTIALLLNLALNVALIPPFGLYGAAVASTASYLFSAGYILGSFMKATDTRLGDVLVAKRSDVAFAAAAARALLARQGGAR